MRSLIFSLSLLIFTGGSAFAQAPNPEAPGPAPGAAPAAGQPPPVSPKENANPCRDEVATALQKLRKTSWFRMTTNMITENGPVAMEVDYVLPDRMHQKVTQVLSKQNSEIILVGEHAWSTDGTGWQPLQGELTQQLKAQMYETVVEQQTDVGNYSCKGKVQIEGRDAMAYKLEDEPSKDSTAPKNETYRMFYVDALTGMPLGNALLAPGREKTPLFKASYSYPIDMKVEPPADAGKGEATEAPKEPGK